MPAPDDSRPPIAAWILALGIFSFVLGQSAQAGVEEAPPQTIDLTAVKLLYGGIETDRATNTVVQRCRGSFPPLLRLPVRRPKRGPWKIELKLTRLMSDAAPAERMQAEGVGILLDDGVIQVWWGGEKLGGARLTVHGKTVASDKSAVLKRQTHAVGIAVNDDGALAVRLDGRRIISHKVPLGRRVSPIDLGSRNSSIRWSDAKGWNLTTAAPDQQPEWLRRPGEPAWFAEEAVLNGYQPVKSHLWNRWLQNFVPAPAEWPGIPWVKGPGESPVTHGPLLGKPDQNTIAVWCRTQRPMQIDVVAGPGDDPHNWRVVGRLHTTAELGNTGHAVLKQGAFADEAVNYSLRAQGKVIDLREAGRWPSLKRRWLAPETAKAIRLAVWCGDNLFPVPPSVYPSLWQSRQRNLDLMIHLGDFVYEQAYRRRVEVSRLDYLMTVDPSHPGGRRGRHAPLVAVLDDHEMFNDVTGNGEVYLFRNPPRDRLPRGRDIPWRISSRDVGWAAWEEFLGWGTPCLEHLRRSPIVLAKGVIENGAIRVDDEQVLKQLERVDRGIASTLVIWPKGNPVANPVAITPPSAGSYRFRGINLEKGLVQVDPPAPGSDHVHFSLSRPRYGSLRLGSAELLLLDTRTMRTLWNKNPRAPGPTVLGRHQLDWLLERIAESDARVLLLASSVTWKFHNSFTLGKRDSWTGYAHERDRIIDACSKSGKTVLLLSGDLHNAAVRRLDTQIWEVLAGAWSNDGFRSLEDSTEAVEGLPNNGILWSAPEHPTVERHWATNATLLTIEGNKVLIEVLNLATNKIEFRTTVPPSR